MGAVRSDQLLLEQGESRGKSQLQDIEFAISRVGQVCLNLAKGHYLAKKIFRIVQPNNNITETTINVYTKRDKEVATIVNDITLGAFDVKVVGGSTLPSNREKDLQMALESYKLGLMNKIDVWKKMEIDDLEQKIQYDSELAQAKSMISSLEEQLKKLQGDMQTADRELKVADRRVEREKVKSDLTQITSKAKAGQEVTQVKTAERSASILDKASFQVNQLIASMKQGKDVEAPKKKK